MKIIKENVVLVLTIAIGVFVGLVLGGLLYWNITTLISTTDKTNDIISFINSNIAASQQAEVQ